MTVERRIFIRRDLSDHAAGGAHEFVGAAVPAYHAPMTGSVGARRARYLEAMGITRWVRRGAPAETASSAAVSAAPETAAILDAEDWIDAASVAAERVAPAAMDWQTLERTVAACTQCRLHAGRTQTVFGVGARNASWLFIGEAPGAEEDRQGEPFVGRAGQLLNAMFFAVGLKREEVYIANILKCRPPGNRDPQPDEIAHCEPYLIRQIELIGPRLIVALGRHAAHSLLKTELPLGKLRGQRLSYHGTPLIVTYHPAYLLRNLADKRKTWDDLRLAKRIVGTQ